MNLIKIELAKLKGGHVRSICDIVVMRIADRFIFSETINIRSTGVDIDSAARGIFNLCRER
tara:strand:- start:19280 stop:19462 length:183 start_codon:yes stop_codon:yes gene_type:complete